MPKAARRVSRPRRTAPKIKPKKVASNEDRAKALLDLESPMHELWCMAQIVDTVINQREVSTFATFLLCEKVREVHARYRTGLYEKPVQR
jgi:hypothetical protein